MKQFNGKCSCGDIKYRFEGEPMNSVFCYCHECQELTGSDKWFGLWVAVDKFEYTEGKPSVFTRKGDSGADVKYNFCGVCGTTLCAEITIGNFYSVGVTTLVGDSGFSPKMSIYSASAPSWAVFPDGVPKFDKLPPGMGGKKAE